MSQGQQHILVSEFGSWLAAEKREGQPSVMPPFQKQIISSLDWACSSCTSVAARLSQAGTIWSLSPLRANSQLKRPEDKMCRKPSWRKSLLKCWSCCFLPLFVSPRPVFLSPIYLSLLYFSWISVGLGSPELGGDQNTKDIAGHSQG